MARVLITGSADGLGQAAAEDLIADGHEVIVHAGSAERLAAVEPIIGRGAWAVVGDLSDVQQIRSVADQVNRLGRVDAAIHNAGVLRGPHLLMVNVVAPTAVPAMPVAASRRKSRLAIVFSISMAPGGGGPRPIRF
jgi:NAD(P)-dependent dehydrogenase (short-subunit alcohol dehydrogenase family)